MSTTELDCNATRYLLSFKVFATFRVPGPSFSGPVILAPHGAPPFLTVCLQYATTKLQRGKTRQQKRRQKGMERKNIGLENRGREARLLVNCSFTSPCLWLTVSTSSSVSVLSQQHINIGSHLRSLYGVGFLGACSEPPPHQLGVLGERAVACKLPSGVRGGDAFLDMKQPL